MQTQLLTCLHVLASGTHDLRPKPERLMMKCLPPPRLRTLANLTCVKSCRQMIVDWRARRNVAHVLRSPNLNTQEEWKGGAVMWEVDGAVVVGCVLKG